MSTSRPTRRTTTSKRGGSVGGNGKGSNLQLIFLGSVIAVVLAFVVLLTVAADAFSGDDKPPVIPASTATETAASEPTAATSTSTSTSAASAVPGTATQAPTVGDDGTIEVKCGDILAPLDKQHRLPGSCSPGDLVAIAGGVSLRAEAAGAFAEMVAAAKTAGFTLYSNSGYRSYSEQASTYQYWVNTQGKEYADRTSARAGHSEHQLGTTADVAARGLELEAFSGTAEAAWLLANSYKFGFIVSYPDGKEAITGYAPEPWHIRYVGKDVAQQVRSSGLTLHEFLLK